MPQTHRACPERGQAFFWRLSAPAVPLTEARGGYEKSQAAATGRGCQRKMTGQGPILFASLDRAHMPIRHGVSTWATPLPQTSWTTWATPPTQPPSSKRAKASLNGSEWEAIDFNKEILLA